MKKLLFLFPALAVVCLSLLVFTHRFELAHGVAACSRMPSAQTTDNDPDAAAKTRPVEWLALLASALVTQNWMLAAADIRLSGAKGNIAKLGLTKIQADTLRVWLKDDDSGLARTMAALDRKLRDGEALMKRLETPIALCSGLARVFRSLREERTSSKTQAHDRAD